MTDNADVSVSRGPPPPPPSSVGKNSSKDSVIVVTARVLLQQCLSAVLQTRPSTESTPAEYVKIGRGLVVYVCFLQGATMTTVQKIVDSVLNVRLSEADDAAGKYVSILELPGNVIIVPQATLGGRLKGKVMQYHANVDKTTGEQLYTELVRLVRNRVENSPQSGGPLVGVSGQSEVPSSGGLVPPGGPVPPGGLVPGRYRTECGTYGNRQVLTLETNGPYSHVIEF